MNIRDLQPGSYTVVDQPTNINQLQPGSYSAYDPLDSFGNMAQPKKSVATRVSGALGFGKTVDTLGSVIARARATPQEKQFLPAPTTREKLGAGLQLGALGFPGATVAKGVAGVASKILPQGISRAVGAIGAGATGGLALDAGRQLEQGEKVRPGLGTAVGAAIPGGSLAAGAIGRSTAPRIINSLIKPLAKDFSYGKNPGRTISDMGIKANSFDDLVTKIGTSRASVGAEIGALNNKIEGKVKLNLVSSLNPLDEAMQTAAKSNNSTLLQRLQNVKQAIVEDLMIVPKKTGGFGIGSRGAKNLTEAGFNDSRKILGDIGAMTQWTGNPSDDKLVNAALKQVYGSIKEQTLSAADSVSPEIGTQLRKVHEQYADLISAEIAAKYRDKIMERSNLVGLSPTVAGLGTGLATAVATGGAALPVIGAGIAGAAVDKALSSTAVKTRLASGLSKLGKPSTFRTPGDILLKKATQLEPKGGLSIQDVSDIPDFSKINKAVSEYLKKTRGAVKFPKGDADLEGMQLLDDWQSAKKITPGMVRSMREFLKLKKVIK